MNDLRRDFDRFDGVWREEFRYSAHEDTLYRKLSQPSRGAILTHTAAIRREGAVRDLEWGTLAAIVPVEDLNELRERYPDLGHTDGRIQRAAWVRFLNTSEGRKYAVHERREGRGRGA